MSLIFTLTLAFAMVVPAEACTSLRVKTTDGNVFYARTMELALPTHPDLIVVPKETNYQGTLPDGTQKGLNWTSKYGFVGMHSPGVPVVIDGVNEKGLAAGGLMFPDFAEYEAFDPAKADTTIAQYEVLTWILSNFATVEEVRQAIKDIHICQVQAAEFGALPVHYVVHDVTGDCLVIEYVKGKLNLYDNPLGVCTNSPPFDWMMINLRNFINLTASNVPELKMEGLTLKEIGQGTGMLGLPGDFTPPSRFVRAVALTQSALPVDGPDAGLALAINIINNVDIPRGAVRGKLGMETEFELTQWAAVADLARKRFYFRTYDNLNWRYVDLEKALQGAKGILTIPVNVPADYPDVTATAEKILETT